MAESSSPDYPAYRAKVRSFYFARFDNGYLRFGLTNVLVAGGIIAALWLMHTPRWPELAALPVAFLVANLVEWLAHRGPMHHRTGWIPVLFDRHTLVHHVYFPHDDMAVRGHREWLYVLFPAFAILLVFAVAVPLALGFGLLFGRNMGCLFFIVATGYYLMYEWLHLMYHLPAQSRIGRARVVRLLRRHHQEHHNPRRMQRYNFNITFPIFDYVFGTAWRGERDEG